MESIFLGNEIDENSMNLIINKLHSGAVGVFPTDTVYGIGCNAFDEVAIKKLFKLKNRSFSKPINVLVSNKEMLSQLTNGISAQEQKLIDAFWPGPLTIIFEKSRMVPNLLTSNLDTVGVRMPNNKICLDILNSFDTPIAMSSANISDFPPATCLEEIKTYFNDNVDFVIDSGVLNIGVPSTIVKFEDNKVVLLREGPISLENINKVLEVF